MPMNSNSNNSSDHSLDSGRANGRHSSQTPVGRNVNQFALNAGIDINHLRNQPLNSFEHGLEGLQTRYKQGNAARYGFGHIGSSERAEAADSPVNFDFQQQIRSQHLGMSPHPGHHSGFDNTQLWQQHLLCKQLEELQRQQQIQQPDLGSRRMSVTAEQTGGGQSPPLLNGALINNASNYTQQNSFGGELKTPSNSQMFGSSNMNRAQLAGFPVLHGYSTGLMFRNDQRQATQPVGFAPQKIDALHGMPTSSTIDSSIQYPHYQGMSPDCTDVMTKAGGNQGYHASLRDESGSVISGNFQQVDPLQENIQSQGFEDRQKQADWSGNFQEKAATLVGPSCGMATLDPTEEKLLFGTGDNDTWDASFGSWSALVQDAVLGSCDDKGLYEEQNCVSFQKTKSSTGNHPALLYDNEKQQATGDDNKQSFKEAKISQFDLSQKQKQFSNGGFQAQMLGTDATNDVSARNTREPVVNIAQNRQGWFEQNVPLSDVSSHHNIKPNGCNINEPVASGGENTSKFQYSNNQKQYAQRTDSKKTMQVENACDGSMRNVGGNHVNLSGLEPESNTGSQHIRMEDSYIGSYAAGTNSNTEKIRQKVLNKNQVDFMKLVVSDSLVMSKEEESVGKYQHQSNTGSHHLDSSPNSNGKGSDETSVKKQEHRASFSEYYTSNHPHLGQHIDNRNVEGNTKLLTGHGSYPSNSVGEEPSGQAGEQVVAPRRFQYHPTGNLGMNVDPANSPTQTSYSQGLSKSVTGGLQNQEQGYTGSAQFAGRLVSNNVMSLGKGQYTNLQRSLKEAEEMHLNHNSTASASFDGSTVQFSHNNRAIQTSQNMLELLHKMNRSRESNNIRHFISSDNNLAPNIPETSPADVSASHPQHNQSSMLQGFGLPLALPTQRQLMSDHILPSQASLNDINIKQDDTEAEDRDRTRQKTVPVRSLSTSPKTSQQESSDSKFSKHACKNTSHSSSQVSSLQQQAQHQISAPGHEVMDQPVNFPSGSQANVNANVKHASLLGQSRDTYEQGVSDKYFQTPLPSASGRIPPFRLPSSDHAPASQYHLANAGHSQPRDAVFDQLTNSGQQLSHGETRSVSTMPQRVPAQQHSTGAQPHKLTPNLRQATLKSTSSRDTSSWALQKADDHTIQTNRGTHALSEFGASSSPEQLAGAEKFPVKDDSSQGTASDKPNATPKNGAASQCQASAKHLTNGDSSVSISSLVRLHQQENKGKGGPEQVPLPNIVSSSGIAPYGCTSKPSDTSLHKYSLLQQMQALKGSDAPRSECKAGQRFIYGQNTAFRIPLHGEHSATSHNSFPLDAKMLSFSSKGNDETSASASSHLVCREVSSQDKYTSSQHHLQNHTHSLGISSTSNLIRGNQDPMVSQMGSSFFEQYGDHNKGRIHDTLDRQRSAKSADQQFPTPKVSEILDKNILIDQRADSDQAGSFRPSISPTTMAAEQSPPFHLLSDITNEAVALNPKKRKSTTPELLLWQKEVTQGSQRLHNIVSTAQLHWAQATNRLAEKVEDEAEMIDDCLSMPRSRRRIILTTHLLQQLLPSVPSAIIAAAASSAYESVAYFVAKKALGDACSLISYSRINSRFQLDRENTISEKLKTSEKVGCHIMLKVVDDFMGRSRKLEIDLSRLKTRVSCLDLRMECEELERFSIINRLVKFHGRTHTEAVDSSSASKTVPRRTFPQRYVTAFTMPGNQTEGVPCLLL